MSDADRMDRWRPCSRKCQLAGSACFLLSLSDSVVLMNGPRWCANLASAFLSRHQPGLGDRIFCTEVGQSDMVFGTGNLVLDSLGDIEKEYTPKVVGVLNSCSVSLIGDDIKGLCDSQNRSGRHYVCLDSGGLRGEFYEGFQEALGKWIGEIPFPAVRAVKEKQVNIIGWCRSYPGWEANLAEIRRLLAAIGLEVGVVLGADRTTVEECSEKLPEAACNLVLYPELGLPAARHLERVTGVPYFLCPVPYGFTGSLAWLRLVMEKVGNSAALSVVEKEVEEASSEMGQAVGALSIPHGKNVWDALYVALPEGDTLGISMALKREFLPYDRLYCRVDGPCLTGETIPGTIKGPFPRLGEKTALVIGNDFTRIEVGHFQKNAYMNLLLPASPMWPKNKGYAGIRGWEFFMSDVLSQARRLLEL